MPLGLVEICSWSSRLATTTRRARRPSTVGVRLRPVLPRHQALSGAHITGSRSSKHQRVRSIAVERTRWSRPQIQRQHPPGRPPR